MCRGRCSGRYTNILLSLHWYITDTLPSTVDISIDIINTQYIDRHIIFFFMFLPMLFQSSTYILVEYRILWGVNCVMTGLSITCIGGCSLTDSA